MSWPLVFFLSFLAGKLKIFMKGFHRIILFLKKAAHAYFGRPYFSKSFGGKINFFFYKGYHKSKFRQLRHFFFLKIFNTQENWFCTKLRLRNTLEKHDKNSAETFLNQFLFSENFWTLILAARFGKNIGLWTKELEF